MREKGMRREKLSRRGIFAGLSILLSRADGAGSLRRSCDGYAGTDSCAGTDGSAGRAR